MTGLSLGFAKPWRRASLGVLAAIVYLAFAIAVGVSDVIFVLRHFTRFPFGDHWIWLEVFHKNGLLVTLFSQFNEHRLFVPGLFYFLDHRYFGSTNVLLTFLLILMQAGCILLAILPFWRRTENAGAVRYCFAGSVVIVMLWFIQAEDFFYSYQICFICCNLCILGTLHLFASLVERARRSQPLIGVCSAMLACALAANFSNGHGILIWPVLLAAGLIVRLPIRCLSMVGLAMVVALGIYFFHYHTPAQHASPLESLRQPIRAAQYIVLLMGLPFFGVGSQDIALSTNLVSYCLSVAGILVAAILLLRFMIGKALRRCEDQIIYSCLTLLCLGACFITALGRSRFPLSQALTGRYAPIPLLFWVALAALSATSFSNDRRSGNFTRAVWCGVFIVASTATLKTQRSFGEYMALRKRSQEAAALSITVGAPDLSAVDAELGKRLDRIRFVDREATRFLGHSLFWRSDAAFLGDRLSDHFQLAPASECTGVVDAFTVYETPTRGVHLLGWAWDGRMRSGLDRIWIVDQEKTIRGLGIVHLPRADVSAVYSNAAMDSSGWVAYSPSPQQEQATLTVFGNVLDTKSVCQIGTSRITSP